MKRIRHRLQELYRAGGLLQVGRQITHALATSLYFREDQYIMVVDTDVLYANASSDEREKTHDIECVIVESPAALQGTTCTIPPAISCATLTHRLEQGCIVILACKPRQRDHRMDCVGCCILERGVFSALGRREHVSSDTLFIHHVEVLPAYRGQRVYYAIQQAQFVYARSHGIRKVYGVISINNPASLRGGMRAGYAMKGVLTRVACFRGLFVWETPWRRIAQALGEVESGRRN